MPFRRKIKKNKEKQRKQEKIISFLKINPLANL
jgi:hypothetical protein